MGQGLIPEAVDELTEAAKDKRLAIESYSLISQCYRQKRDFDEAAKWMKRAMAEAKAGTDQYYALVYELAEIMEAADDREKAAGALPGDPGLEPRIPERGRPPRGPRKGRRRLIRRPCRQNPRTRPVPSRTCRSAMLRRT